ARAFRPGTLACEWAGGAGCASDLSGGCQRKRTADETRDLSEQPARPAHPRFHDFAGIDDRLPAGEAPAEAAADREWEREPFRFRHQCAEAEITQFGP